MIMPRDKKIFDFFVDTVRRLLEEGKPLADALKDGRRAMEELQERLEDDEG